MVTGGCLPSCHTSIHGPYHALGCRLPLQKLEACKHHVCHQRRDLHGSTATRERWEGERGRIQQSPSYTSYTPPHYIESHPFHTQTHSQPLSTDYTPLPHVLVADNVSSDEQQQAATSSNKQAQAGTSRHKQAQAGTSRHKQAQAGTSRNKQEQAATSSNKQQQAGTSRNKQEQAGTSRNKQQYELEYPSSAT